MSAEPDRRLLGQLTGFSRRCDLTRKNMDTMDHRTEHRFPGKEPKPIQAVLHHEVQMLGPLDRRHSDGAGWNFVEVLLTGGAPWGFTLRGGREHQEPLLITKVEENSIAARVKLQVGDEIVSINDVPLSGYRQEAICLVKGSHKTLSLVVRRRSEPAGRPHSWHSTKFTEGQVEAGKAQPPPTALWHTRYDASPQEPAPCWDQTNLRRVSDQFSSLGSMDSLEQSSHPFPSGRLSPAKSNSSVDHVGGSKRDSAYSSYSTGSGTPDYTLSRSNAASTENVLHKLGQWDAGVRVGRNSYSLLEGGRQDERALHLVMPMGPEGRESPRTEEPPGSRNSASYRSCMGPVWHVPEKKRPAAPSPPPPPPPVRSDSFSVTKVHEKGLVFPYSEGPAHYPQQKGPGRATDHGPSEGHDGAHRGPRSSERGPEAWRGYHLLKPDFLYPHATPDAHGYENRGNQAPSDKLYSSSGDVRLSQPGHTHPPHHQRQYSDESTFYPQPRAASGPWQQSAAGCYSSMQELSSSGQAQSRSSSASLSSVPIDQLPDSEGHNCYYCVTTRQPGQAALVRVEGWKAGEATPGAGGQRGSVSSPVAFKARPPALAQQHQPYLEAQGSNSHYRQEVRLASDAGGRDNPTDGEGQWGNNGHVAEGRHVDSSRASYSEEKTTAPGLPKEAQPEVCSFPEEAKLSPQRTPMLHSLTQEGMSPAEAPKGAGHQEAPDPAMGKSASRSDRYSTTLRNEILMKRAQLQKSKSTASLGGSTGDSTEDAGSWEVRPTNASPCDGTFSSTYKDNLKEVQARVLRATSFRRRDLEPVPQEHPSAEPVPGHTAQGPARKDAPVAGPSEALPGKATLGQVSRIGCRKRFPSEKKVRSFSEPDKINEVGVEEEVPPQEGAGSFADRRRVFEIAGRPTPPQAQPLTAPDERGEGRSASQRPEGSRGGVRLADKQALLEQQRLGTFAEYEATWNVQRKPAEVRTAGRYRSADNILDPAMEECSRGSYVHERSRSSPSADFYGQDLVALGRKPAEYSQAEGQPASWESATSRLSDREHRQHLPSIRDNLEDGGHRRHLSHHQRPPQDTEPPPPPPALRKKGPAPQRPPPPRLDKYRWPEAVSSSRDSQESLHDHQGSHLVMPLSTGEAPPPGPDHTRGSSSSPERDPQKATRPEDEQGAGHRVSLFHPEPAPPHAAISSSSSSSLKPAPLLNPSMDEYRSLSPQFAPQRLTDKPPVSLPDEASSRMDNAMESGMAVRKVPIKIVHAESSSEKESRGYLMPSKTIPAPGGPSGPDGRPLSTRGPSELSYSPFSAYMRQTDAPLHTGSKWDQGVGMEPPGAPREGPCDGSPPAAAANGHSEEDRKREELAQDIVSRDKSLADILDQRKMKTTMDLMEGIFPQGGQLLEEAQQRRKAAPQQPPRSSTEPRREEDNLATTVTMVTSSSYYSTSAPKAELLIKMKGMQEQIEEHDSEDELDIDLANKKHELIDSLSRKLQVLREARESLQEDVRANNMLGEEVELTVQGVCKPNELDKFRMFVGDLDKVVSLLLSLSGRLARVENALNSLEEGASAEEMRTLVEKRKLLIRQHDDAKELKENLDRRERVVYDILASYLSEDHLADYEHFVKMKSALIIEQRKLEDKIKLGEEQLKCLTDSLPLEQRRPF